MSKWTEFVKDFARRHNLSYACALSDKRCSQEYKQYKINELNIPEIPKIIKKKFKEKPKLLPEILEIPKIIKKKFKEKPKLIPEIPEIPKKSKTPLEISEQWLKYMEIHNIPDFLENKKELKKRYKEELREIAEHFGLKVSKYDDKEKLANIIVNFATNYDESLLPEIPEIPEIPKKSKRGSRTPNSQIKPLTERLDLFLKYYNIPIEDAFKNKKFLTNFYNIDLIEISKSLGIEVSKYDDKSKLINKILKFTTS